LVIRQQCSSLDYALKSDSLEEWFENNTIMQALDPIRKNQNYMDSDQLFCVANDEDYDPRSKYKFIFKKWPHF
jgi:hypothetical protein